MASTIKTTSSVPGNAGTREDQGLSKASPFSTFFARTSDRLDPAIQEDTVTQG
jgi:hypothetical protein